MLKSGLSVIKGAAQNFISLLSCPSIGLPSGGSLLNSSFLTSGAGKLLAGTLLKGLPIFCSEYSEELQNQIGQQVVIAKGNGSTNSNIACDNVAPQPRVWKMNGYISFGAEYNLAGVVTTDSVMSPLVKLSNEILKLGGTASGVINSGKTGEQILLMMCKVYLRWIRSLRGPFRFTTREGEQVDALIRNLRFIDEPDTDNAVHVDLEVVEYYALYMYNTKDNFVTGIVGNSPTLGSIFGSPTTLFALSASATVTLGKMLPKSLVSDLDDWINNGGSVFSNSGSSSFGSSSSGEATTDFGQSVSQENADDAMEEEQAQEDVKTITFLDADGNLVTTEAPAVTSVESSAEILDAGKLSEVCEAAGLTISALITLLNNPLRTTMFVAEAPFADLAGTDEEGNVEYKEAVSVNVEAGDCNLQIELRKTLSLGYWWLGVTGTAGTVNVNRGTRITFNTCCWNNCEFTLMLVSSTLPADGETEFEDLTEDEQNAALAGAMLVITR